jgi:hypothetical protein
MMAYTLEQFVADARAALKATPGPAGRQKVSQHLERLLANTGFIEQHLGPQAPLGRHTLYEDKELGFVVLAHVNKDPHKSPPHDHGHSWAVYGQAYAYTDMTEYRRLDSGSGAGTAELEEVKRYRLQPGKAGVYDVGNIHAIDYPANTRMIRVTGKDLDHIECLRYDTQAKTAELIKSVSASKPRAA